MFFTLTFPKSAAPSEDEAHECWRSLCGRLRYREYLSAYAWVLQRQQKGTGSLHFHGVAHLKWFEGGDLSEWRSLILKSGFGVQNKLALAEPQHAAYCARYISTRLATLAPLRRAFAFSRDFPQSRHVTERRALAEQYGVVAESDCTWTPARGLLN